MTDFSILQPAIDYYERHGSATEKLRTFYYQGRIYQNIRDDASAMNCFLHALDVGGASEDALTRARLLVAQGNIYYSLMKWDKVSEANLSAADIFNCAQRKNSYVNCLLKAASGFIQNHDFKSANECFSRCKPYLDEIPVALLSNYYSEFITCLTQSGDTINLDRTILEYKTVVPDYLTDYATLANAYISSGEYEKALAEISKVSSFSGDDSEMRYYAILAELFQKTGHYEESLDNYLKFNAKNDSVLLSIFAHDTRFIEERHSLELQAIKAYSSRNTMTLVMIIILISLIFVILMIWHRLRIRTIRHQLAEERAEHFRVLYQNMEYERDNLSRLLATENSMLEKSKEIVRKRLELLNKFLAAYITDQDTLTREADKDISNLIADKEVFLSSTVLSFTGTNPRFILYLKDHHLTDNEIQYCCLYALGLNGKEVGGYLNRRSHYNISSEVRAKLGLSENDTNLGIYIRRLLHSL
ncbi:MAG: tetratricopeptide repeat protein [Candidatus Cryptobacteroides sp.]